MTQAEHDVHVQQVLERLHQEKPQVVIFVLSAVIVVAPIIHMMIEIMIDIWSVTKL